MFYFLELNELLIDFLAAHSCLFREEVYRKCDKCGKVGRCSILLLSNVTLPQVKKELKHKDKVFT